MTRASIPVDLTNPGQVFACLGLVEAARVLMRDARGAFDWNDPENVRFHIETPGPQHPVGRVLKFLNEARVDALAPPGSANTSMKWKVPTIIQPSGSNQFPYPDPRSAATLPAQLSDRRGNSIVIDYWGDDTDRDNAKFWAGMGGYPGAALVRDSLDQMRGRVQIKWQDPFALSALQSSSLRLDWRRDYVPMQIGFSPNHHARIVMQGYPAVEVLAAIGLTNARPRREHKLRYSYAVAGYQNDGPLLPLMYLQATLGAARPPFAGMNGFRKFHMQLNWPGQEDQARCITNVIEEEMT